jgi:predicted phosphodiesterase
MHFDLVSDLHENFWPPEQNLKWEGLGTSLIAVVAGDISMDWEYSYEKLVEISKHYRHTIFVDGNHEHNYDPNLHESCARFQEKIAKHHNITFLYKNVIILDDTAFVGCNGWWTYDFGLPETSATECWDFLVANGYNEQKMAEILAVAKIEAKMLYNQIETFNDDPRINNIIVVTHTAPLRRFRFVPDYMDKRHYGRSGNSLMQTVLLANTNQKIKVWCFGHEHTEIDQVVDGIRYVCHPRGRKDEGFGEVYFPKLIKF